jgi:hypothetical protein
MTGTTETRVFVFCSHQSSSKGEKIMNALTRREALTLTATAGIASGVAMFGTPGAYAQNAADAPELVDPTEEERVMWERFVAEPAPANKAMKKAKVIPIPYTSSVGAVTIAGVLYLRPQVEESDTRGTVFGAINGSYHLSKSESTATLYDPTGALFRLELEINIKERWLKARLCHRVWPGKWKCSGWVTVVSW